MQFKSTKTIKYLPLIGIVHGPLCMAVTNDIAGTWSSVTLSGNLETVSPSLRDFRWQIMDQARTRDDSVEGMRLSENLLFGQLGYALDQHSSVGLGYVHDWIHPLDKLAYQENRPYEDYLWNYSTGDLKFTGRFRLEQRIRADTGDIGVRTRELLQMNYALGFIDKDLSAYVGDEVLEYTNKNTFGRTGFSENRVLAGFSYQFTKKAGADLGYLGQYVQNLTGPDLFTHNVQFNLSYKF
jgi:hypothetical protein